MLTTELTPNTNWNYDEAFSRHGGLLSSDEQQTLRNSRVAIIGMGGVGGGHLMTLARLGIGAFTIADPDTFELANFNRQYGANVETLGRSKVEVMAEMARRVNPELDIRTLAAPIDRDNVGEFLEGADLLVDGVDFFALDARRLVFQEARRRGIWAVTAGPHAFSTAWMTFDPKGMSFDEFFDMHDGMDETDKLVAFSVGCVPSPIHLKYAKLSRYFRPEARAGASAGFACQLASGVVGAETTRILLSRPGAKPVPCYFQFDAYRQILRSGKLRWGNRHPWQRLKRWWLKRRIEEARRIAARDNAAAGRSLSTTSAD
jgi:molybdopterin/thiamine biosynthesis adenylyltransferase